MTAPYLRRCRPLLGTFVEIAVPPERADATDAAFAAIAHVHAAMSFHAEDSDLGRLRRAPAGATVRVDPQTVTVLRLAADLHARSGGLFDVTVGRALVQDGFLPCPRDIALDRMVGGAEDIELAGDDQVRCRRPLLIDLGGIAKGHAVDRAIACLREAGVASATVNAGGDLRVLGSAPQPIHLRAADGAIEAMVMLADGALASSSNLLDRRRRSGRVTVPHRGRGHRPMPTREAISVAAPTCAVADAMTKIVLADPALGTALLAAYGGWLVDRAAGRRAA